MRDLPIYTRYMELQQELRKAHQEAQQWEDETCLEIDELDSIIDGQQEYIKTLQAQLHNTLERKFQMSFEIQQEIAALKHHLSDTYEKNRRLCSTLEDVEKVADQALSDRDWCRGEIFRLKEVVEGTEREWQKSMKEAADARRSNNCLLDQLQAAEAKLEWLRQNKPDAYAHMHWAAPSAP